MPDQGLASSSHKQGFDWQDFSKLCFLVSTQLLKLSDGTMKLLSDVLLTVEAFLAI